MAVTYVGTLTSYLTVVKTDTLAEASDQTIAYAADNENIALGSATTPAVTKASQFQKTLSGGAGTIDLTALPGLSPDETIDCTGLKVQQIKFTNPDTNANKMVISQGASNGWQIDGVTNWSFPLGPGQSILMNCDDQSDAVDGTHKDIDIAGTGSQILHIIVTLG